MIAPALVTIAPALVTIAVCCVGCGSSLSRWLVIHGSTWGVYFTWILCLYSVVFTIGGNEVFIVCINTIGYIQTDGFMTMIDTSFLTSSSELGA